MGVVTLKQRPVFRNPLLFSCPLLYLQHLFLLSFNHEESEYFYIWNMVLHLKRAHCTQAVIVFLIWVSQATEDSLKSLKSQPHWVSERTGLTEGLLFQTAVFKSHCRTEADGFTQTLPPCLCRISLDKLHEYLLCDEYKHDRPSPDCKSLASTLEK